MVDGDVTIKFKAGRLSLFRNKEASRLIKKCNDFGAGGVSVAIGELADGLIINLDAVPKKYEGLKKLPLQVAKRLSFADPYACAIFQLERMEDLGEAQNFRVEMAKHKCSEAEARKLAKENIFSNGCGNTLYDRF